MEIEIRQRKKKRRNKDNELFLTTVVVAETVISLEKERKERTKLNLPGL